MATCRLCSAMMLSRINQRLGSLMLNPVSRGLTDSAGVSARGRRGNPNRKQKRESGQPRREKMLPDQDWTSVYPTAAAFKPGSVPLPIRMGYPVERGVPPPKEGNLELMKIPNFLHLTPAAINKHCDALKVFCTEWPSALDSDAKCEERFPIKVQSSDFVFAGPSLRNSDARVITLKVKLSSLNLDDHARKKLVKLVGERYCKQTDILTLTADRCPLKKQNKDYVLYLLTVLYHESWKMESWEQEKTVEDMEEYVWEGSASQSNVLDTLQRMKEVPGSASAARDQLQEYSASVSRLKNEGESEDSVLQYRKAVKRVLFL